MPKRLLPGLLVLAASLPAVPAELPTAGGAPAVRAGKDITGLMHPTVSPVPLTAPGQVPGADAATLDALLSAAGLRVAEARAGAIDVPLLFAAALPDDMAQID